MPLDSGLLEVNGRRRHPLCAWLTAMPDAEGRAGKVDWNFEKFLVSPNGEVVARLRLPVEPEDERVVRAKEAVLAELPSRRGALSPRVAGA